MGGRETTVREERIDVMLDVLIAVGAIGGILALFYLFVIKPYLDARKRGR